MRKWLIIFSPLFFLYQSLEAQENVGCSQLLEDAREAYSAGMVEVVPALLLPCLEPGGLTGIPRQEAYKLVINAYLFDYLPQEADSLMDDFVAEFPEYKASSTDPAEFTRLLESHQPEITETLVGKEAIVVAQKEKPKIRTPYIYKNSMGFLVGGNRSFPKIMERYSIGDPETSNGSFDMMAGFQAGVNLNLQLNKSMEATVGLLFSQSRFHFTDTPFSFTSYQYEETQSHLQVPALLLFRLNPNSSGVSVYMQVGVGADYLLSARGNGTRSFTQTSMADVEVPKTTITGSRTRLNLLGLAAMGMRIPFENSFIFIETRFAYGLFNSNQGENRYHNDDLIWNLYHVDSDFKIHQLSLSAGMAWNL